MRSMVFGRIEATKQYFNSQIQPTENCEFPSFRSDGCGGEKQPEIRTALEDVISCTVYVKEW